MTDAFDHVVFRGRLMDKKTASFLMAMEEDLGYQLTVVQGCYNVGGVGASAGTHDLGGVVDLAAWDSVKKVLVARKLGAFAWYRSMLPGVWAEHIHLGIRNHGNLAEAAQHQQQDYDAKPPRNGLANHAIDPTWHPDPPVTFIYPPKEEPTVPEATQVTKARDALVEAIHDLSVTIAHLKSADASRVIPKSQIDDIQAVRKQAKEILAKLPPK
jgi:hypothetical protein